jgi:hypothetical protein
VGEPVTQPGLPLVGSRDRRPKVDDVVPRLIAALSDRGWVTARVLSAQIGSNERALREAAHQSEGRIVSGQRGYALIENVTVAEAQHAAAWLKHQATEMLKRAGDLHRAMHRARHAGEAA